jgi:thioredoxin reductase (NADPH)
LDSSVSECDVAVIGGGPAGLTAALYLGRYHLSVSIFDDATSRASEIPVSHNVPGFPEGISGRDLLVRMRKQAVQYGAGVTAETVTEIRKTSRGFVVSFADRRLEARAVLVATGVADRRPQIPAALHDAAVRAGKLRYCPVCDGYEVTGRAIAVIGSGSHAYSEARFLYSYTRDLSLVSQESTFGLSEAQHETLAKLGVQLVRGPVTSVALDCSSIRMTTPAGEFVYEAVYPALGCDTRASLAIMVGAELSTDGSITVDRHQRSSVAGLYAAGDVVAGLNQISSAMGQGAVAATAIRNDLDSP